MRKLIKKEDLMPLNLQEKIGEAKVVLVVMPNEKYAEDIVEIARELAEKHKISAYVNLNRPYAALTKSLQAKQIDSNKFFFIDGITQASSAGAEEHDNCLYAKGPSDLIGMGIAVEKLFKVAKPEVLLVDSLSTILVYENVKVTLKFAHNLVSKSRLAGVLTIFTALEGDAETELMTELKPFVDKVIPL